MKPLQIVSAAVGEGAMDGGCKYGASALLAAGLAEALRQAGRTVDVGLTVTADPAGAQDRMDTVARFSGQLAEQLRRVVRAGAQPLVLGGDHSCAIGTWSGMADALWLQGRLGLVWVDAHLDAHTPDSSDSKAPHGMPLAALLGQGSPAFTDLCGWTPKLRPENVVVIGARSYESAERGLLEALGVRVIYMDEVRQRGFADCFAEARACVTRASMVWGLSIDIDGLDPEDAPATGTPVAQGIGLAEATAALAACRTDRRMIGLEIAEYNPLKDYGGKTARAVQALAVAALGQAAA